jgi:DNA modification methylase
MQRIKEDLANIKPKPKIVDDKHFLFNADCLEVLKQLPNKSIKLIITDPPYNINLSYNKYNDKKDWETYYSELRERLIEMARVLTDDGSLYLINYPEINARTMSLLDDTELMFRRWLTWHYPSNLGHSKTNYTRSQRSILFYTKTKDNTFNKNAIVQPYKNPNVTKIKKLIEQGRKGRTPYDALEKEDLFEIFNEEMSDFLNFNVLKNVSKDRNSGHPCQLPLPLLKVFIKASSNPGDVVLDCYAGTFTTNKACKDLGRLSVGIEIDKKYVSYGIKRLKEDDKMVSNNEGRVSSRSKITGI